MRNAKWFTVSLVVFCCLLVGLGVFSLWPNGGLVEKAFGQRSPRVIFLGDVDERLEFKHKLPPGYEREPRGLDAINFSVNTFDRDDPNAMFEIGDYTDTAQQIESAKDLGKKTIYFTYEEEVDLDLDVEPPPYEFSPKELIEFLIPPVRMATFDFLGFYPDNANAGAMGDPPTWNCTSNCAVPGGYVYLLYPASCGVSTPRTKFINKNMTVDSSWLSSVVVHKHWNTAWFDGTTQKSFVDCMNSHNGSGFMCNPENLTHNMYHQAADLPFTCCACGRGGPGDPRTTPRTSKNKTVWVAMKSNTNNCDLDRWSVGRHEVAHTYGYAQGDFGMDNLVHCTEPGTPHIVY